MREQGQRTARDLKETKYVVSQSNLSSRIQYREKATFEQLP
jgi:hypothetical protein